jgi:SWI/SNF-related matrix-associated actin-dependent regulator of chromatin subfamily A member 5
MVYRLVSESTVEEKIVERQAIKLRWDSLVIQQGRLTHKGKLFTKDEVKEMVVFGSSKIFKSDKGTYTEEGMNGFICFEV